jgi:WD40 repeat protein
MVAQLEGHQKVVLFNFFFFFFGFLFYFIYVLNFDEQVVSGIALPSDSNTLYTGSKDETVRLWDCTSGQVVIYWV